MSQSSAAAPRLKQVGIGAFFAKKPAAPTPPNLNAFGSKENAPRQRPEGSVAANGSVAPPSKGLQTAAPLPTAEQHAQKNSATAKSPMVSTGKAPARLSSGSAKGSRCRPRELPALEPVLSELPVGARSHALHAWQFFRCMTGEIFVEDGETVEPLSLEEFGALLKDGPSAPSAACGGLLGNYHRALLRALLQPEDERLDTVDNDEIIGALRLPAHDPLAGDGLGSSGRFASEAGVSDSTALSALPLESAVRFSDLATLMDELSWPEILRRLVLYLDAVVVDSADACIEPELRRLAAHLEMAEYHSAPAELKVAALAALCDRVLDGGMAKRLDDRYEDVLEAGKREGREAASLKRAAKEAARGAKEEAAARKRACVEAWQAYEKAEEELATRKAQLSEALLKQASTSPLRASLRARVDEARQMVSDTRAAHQRAKEASRQPTGAQATDAEARAPAAAPITSRLARKAAAAEEEAKAAEATRARREAERAARAKAAERRKARRMNETLRIPLLGRDRHGARYWILAEPYDDDSDSDDEDGDVRGPPTARLLVESADGDWGEVRSVSALRAALAGSHDSADRQLLAELKVRQAETDECAPRVPPTPEQATSAAGSAAGRLLPAGFVTTGHAWIGRQLRLVRSDGAWEDAQIVAYRPAEAIDDAHGTFDDVDTDGSDDGAAACYDKPLPLAFYTDDGEKLDEATVAEGLAEAEDASLRFLARGLLDAEEELHGELPSSAGGKKAKKGKGKGADGAGGSADDMSRDAWRERVKASKTVREMRARLAELGEQMASEAEASWLLSDDSTAGPSVSATARTLLASCVASWRARLGTCATPSQLALRLVEIEACTLERDGMRAGVPLQVLRAHTLGCQPPPHIVRLPSAFAAQPMRIPHN